MTLGQAGIGARLGALALALRLLLLLGAVPAAANVADGVRRWQAGDWNGAVAAWQEPAARGDADAMFNMGQAYRLGRGVPQNNQTAMEYYRRASDKGHVAATANLGITLFQEGRRAEAMTLLRQAADRGDQRATYVMGIATFNGDGAPRNPVMGYAYMIRAREFGMPQASQQAARMATLLTPAERARAEAVAAALAAGEPVPVDLLSPGTAVVAAASPAEPAASAAAAAPRSSESDDGGGAPLATVASVPASAAPAPATASTTTAAADSAAAAAASDSRSAQRWRVQLGAFTTEQAARTAWANLLSQAAELVEGEAPSFSLAGGMIRLQVGEFADQDGARSLCARLAAAGRPCFVTRS